MPSLLLWKGWFEIMKIYTTRFLFNTTVCSVILVQNTNNYLCFFLLFIHLVGGHFVVFIIIFFLPEATGSRKFSTYNDYLEFVLGRISCFFSSDDQMIILNSSFISYF